VDYAEKLALLAAKDDERLYGRLRDANTVRALMELATLRERNKWLEKKNENLKKLVE